MKMSGGQISLFVLMLLLGVSSGQGPLSLDDTSQIFAVEGTGHALNATVVTDNFADHSIIEIYHKNVLTNAERLLVSMEDYNSTAATITSGYSIAVTDVNATTKAISFGITSLSFDDDGAIDFDIKSTTGEANDTATRAITVVVIPDTLKVKFGDEDEAVANTVTEVGVKSGNYTVYCIVEESNPEVTDITLTLNGDAVTLETGPDSELISAGVRKYTNNVSAIVEVPSDLNETQTLICTAVDYNGDSHVREFLYELSSAREGQKPVLALVLLLAAFLLWHTM